MLEIVRGEGHSPDVALKDLSGDGKFDLACEFTSRFRDLCFSEENV
jgi:hypothetical protein